MKRKIDGKKERPESLNEDREERNENGESIIDDCMDEDGAPDLTFDHSPDLR